MDLIGAMICSVSEARIKGLSGHQVELEVGGMTSSKLKPNETGSTGPHTPPRGKGWEHFHKQKVLSCLPFTCLYEARSNETKFTCP